MAKHLLIIMQAGGMDGLNFVTATDAPSQSELTSLRSAAPLNVPNFTPEVQKTGTITAGSAVVTGIDTAGLSTGMIAYGPLLPRQRNLTISAIGSGELTLSGPSYATATGVALTFKGARHGYRLNESPATGRSPILHFSQHFLADAINVTNAPENAAKTKAAIIANIGPLNIRLAKIGGAIRAVLADGSDRPAVPSDYPKQLTSHNDQQSTWQANAPEGAVEGWGGGIADLFLPEVTGSLNRPLVSISSDGAVPFSAGTEVTPFTISNSGLIRRVPSFTGGFTSDKNGTSATEMANLARQAMQLNPPEAPHDLYSAFIAPAKLAIDYQNVLVNAMEITDPPPSPLGGYSPEGNHGPSDPSPFLRGLKQHARLIHACDPNRGGVANRTAGQATVTVTTEVTIGVANRVSGQTKTTITATNHRLFTSSGNLNNLSDSVIVLGDGAAIDTSIPVSGYKITLEPSDPNNQFFFTSTQTTALVNAPVTVRLKHNLAVGQQVFITNSGFDAAVPEDGYVVVSAPDSVTFTITTTATTALTNFVCKPKIINVPKMVMYSSTPGLNWDTHLGTNEGSLIALNDGLTYYNSLVERMVDADVVTGCITDFGRTMGVNNGGTDHGWGAHIYVFGKSVVGNRVYGTIPDYSLSGPNVPPNGNFLLPSTSVYQYSATFAKWMGASDAEVLGLFPNLANWPTNEWYLGFL